MHIGVWRFLWVSVVLCACLARIEPAAADSGTAAYQSLREGYAKRDIAKIVAAYAQNARVAFEAETPPIAASGHDEIRKLYANLLASLPADQPLDLNFRIEGRRVVRNQVHETGAYRLKLGSAGTGFGRFDVVRDATTGMFTLDRSLPGTRDDFERMAGPLMFAADVEDLDPVFYGRLTGRYRLDDRCDVVVTHSVVRVLIRNTCDQSWRGLERESGTKYAIGTTVRPANPAGKVAFDLPPEGPAARLTLQPGKNAIEASRADRYTRENVSFAAADGTKLAGTVWTPSASPRAATVLVHGSGPQDRNGYASIIAVLADALAVQGHVVLAYDKRGSGGSAGDGARAGFDTLAGDAEAARSALRKRMAGRDVPSGFAGSSQAGWVVAQALRAGAKPDHVILVGAAGSALTVAEQNLYNTGTLMACAGIERGRINLALRQQRAFFAFLRGRGSAAELDQLTEQGRKAGGLSDWLFPRSTEIDRTSADWFNVLDLDFDPQPVWAGYQGALSLILGRYDDSTPTQEVTRRWAGLNRGRKQPAHIAVIENAQHIGLKVTNACETDLGTIEGFAPQFFEALDRAAARRR